MSDLLSGEPDIVADDSESTDDYEKYNQWGKSTREIGQQTVANTWRWKL